MDEFCMHHMPKKALVFLKLSTAGESPTTILLKKEPELHIYKTRNKGEKEI
jgi:hypothetical protein